MDRSSTSDEQRSERRNELITSEMIVKPTRAFWQTIEWKWVRRWDFGIKKLCLNGYCVWSQVIKSNVKRTLTEDVLYSISAIQSTFRWHWGPPQHHWIQAVKRRDGPKMANQLQRRQRQFFWLVNIYNKLKFKKESSVCSPRRCKCLFWGPQQISLSVWQGRCSWCDRILLYYLSSSQFVRWHLIFSCF